MPTYYVKLAGGTGTGADDANAWSYAKLNATTLLPGDTVLFKKGELYRGTISFLANGSVGNPISYGSYGTGANPILSGFLQPTAWTQHAGNIYYTTLTIDRLSMVTVDGVVKGMGRYPKSGYLVYDWHYENAFIGGTSVTALPLDFNGGEVVVKKYRYVIDRHPNIIIANDGIQYDAGFHMEFYGYNNTYSGTNGNGYFIQNHINTLTLDGEWAYNVGTKRLYVYFAAGPTGRVVNAVGVSSIANITSRSYLNFANIDFHGGDYGIYMTESHHINIESCKFRFQGMSPVYGLGSDAVANAYVTVNNCEFYDSNNNAIRGEVKCPNWTITNNKINNTGVIPGMSKSGDGAAIAVCVVGATLYAEFNEIINTGYCAFSFDDADAIIRKNFIDTYCTVKDDGGAIYTYTGLNPLITKNIILNAIGNTEGTGWDIGEPYPKAVGIYLDNGPGLPSHNSTVTDNVIAHGGYGGIMINNVGGETVTGNLVFDRERGIFIIDLFAENVAPTVRDLEINNNTIIAKTDEQHGLFIQLGNPDDIALLGTIDNNIYARPVDESKTMLLYKKFQNTEFPYTLAAWKAKFNTDVNSTKSKVIVNNEDKFLFEYNKTNAPITVQLDGLYHDVEGNEYTDEVVIPAYSGIVLLKYVAIALVSGGEWLTKDGEGLIKKQVFV